MDKSPCKCPLTSLKPENKDINHEGLRTDDVIFCKNL